MTPIVTHHSPAHPLTAHLLTAHEIASLAVWLGLIVGLSNMNNLYVLQSSNKKYVYIPRGGLFNGNLNDVHESL